MPEKSETPSKTKSPPERIYTVAELKDMPPGTTFWHRTLGNCVISWLGSKKVMKFEGNGTERIPWDGIVLFVEDTKPWDQPMIVVKRKPIPHLSWLSRGCGYHM